MAIPSVAFCRYLSGGGHNWRDDDYHAKKFIDALKGKRVNGYARIPVRGRRLLLEHPNEHRAQGWFAAMVYDFLTERDDLLLPFFFVPIPDSGCSADSNMRSRMLPVARDLAREFGHKSEALDVLRWTEPMQPTHRGGTRNVARLYSNLEIVGELPEYPVILLDDVSTWGSHIRAAERRLAENGGDVEFAILAGETVWEQHDDVFGQFERNFEFYR